MAYKVSRITGLPQYDSLPVAKITDYPLEERDYKPYAQCILCVGEESLFLRMWAFEVSPTPASALRCVLYLYPGSPGTALCLTAYPDGTFTSELLRSGAAIPAPGRTAADASAHPFAGEDLQGVYWGCTATVSLTFIESLAGKASLLAGDVFPGNFYKLCDDAPFVHKGSCFPADFVKGPCRREDMGEFTVVSY